MGTEGSPWEIASTLDGKQKVTAGDTVYLLPGIYKRRPEELFDVRLVGMENRAIDGGLSIQEPSAHVWLKGIEIMVSEPTPENPVDPEALTLEADLTYMVGRIASISTS